MNDDLPKALVEVAEIVGRDAALDLAQACGGQRIYVPRPEALSEDGPLVRALGREDGVRIAAAMAGSRLQVPRARRALVKRLAARGVSTAEIASSLNMDLSTASRYRRLG